MKVMVYREMYYFLGYPLLEDELPINYEHTCITQTNENIQNP